MSDLTAVDPTKKYEVKSYAQFSVGAVAEGEDITPPEENRSNTIINKINSDLELTEKVRYFSEENIPVGTGPQPPKVGETTSYKVYWVLSNSLHELEDLKVVTKLPDNINWDDKKQFSVGSLDYNSATREIVWQIGRLPLTVMTANAEFSINFTPSEADKNKIMVVLGGSTVSAIDGETKTNLTLTTKAKTTKLEDDDIASGDGTVE